MSEQTDHERVSLNGVDPEEALRALLKVDPDSEPTGQSDEPGHGPDDAERPDKA